MVMFRIGLLAWRWGELTTRFWGLFPGSALGSMQCKEWNPRLFYTKHKTGAPSLELAPRPEFN